MIAVTVRSDLAMRIARSDAVKTPLHAHGTIHAGIGAPVSHPFPPDADLHRAAGVLNAGKRVAILVGPDELPWVTGSIGLLGTKPSWDLMQNCDTLLMVGSGFPYFEFLPQEGTSATRTLTPAPGAATGGTLPTDPFNVALRRSALLN